MCALEHISLVISVPWEQISLKHNWHIANSDTCFPGSGVSSIMPIILVIFVPRCFPANFNVQGNNLISTIFSKPSVTAIGKHSINNWTHSQIKTTYKTHKTQHALLSF